MSVPNPIPGLHRRKCASCGRENLLTQDVTTHVRTGRRTETRSGLCTGCGKPIIYTIPLGATESTERDVSGSGEVLRSWWRRLGRGPDRSRGRGGNDANG